MRWFRVIFIGFCLASVNQRSFADLLPVHSQITSVVVYPGAALVTRRANVELKAGPQSLSFGPIIPEFDENSLNVSGEGHAQVKILGALLKREYLQQAANEREKSLRKKIEDLEDQMTETTNSLASLQKQREYIDSVKLYAGQQIPRDLVTKMPTVNELEQVREFIGQSLAKINQSQQEANIQLRNLNREKEVLEKELGQVSQEGTQLQRHIVVDVDCEKAGDLSLQVSYLVQGAAWHPVYDARAALDSGKVELTTFGVVQQATGEDWNDVDLTLSTAKPSVKGRMPDVAPWILSVYQPQPVRAAKMQNAADMAQNQYEPYYLASPPMEGATASTPTPAQMAFTQVESKGVAVLYRIPKKASITADGTEQKLPISTQSLTAKFEYSAYPRVSPYAYLGTKVRNGGEEQLLAGRVNVFLEGDFVGASSIDAIGPGEEFLLYLGIDENVKVKRDELERKIDDVLIGGIPSPNRKTSLKYRISVENYKNKPIQLILFDAIPFSDNDRIKVKVTSVNPEPKEKDWEKRSGIWRWEFPLEPRAKKEIFLDFFVEHSRDLQIQGL